MSSSESYFFFFIWSSVESKHFPFRDYDATDVKIPVQLFQRYIGANPQLFSLKIAFRKGLHTSRV